MRFWEAMKALEEGKKVRQKDWPPEWHINITSPLYLNAFQSWDKKNSPLSQAIESEWEMYQEPVKTYTFQEIIPFLKEGKKVKRKSHSGYFGEYLQIQYSDLILVYPGGNAYLWKSEDFEVNDWIVVD